MEVQAYLYFHKQPSFQPGQLPSHHQGNAKTKTCNATKALLKSALCSSYAGQPPARQAELTLPATRQLLPPEARFFTWWVVGSEPQPLGLDNLTGQGGLMEHFFPCKAASPVCPSSVAEPRAPHPPLGWHAGMWPARGSRLKKAGSLQRDVKERLPYYWGWGIIL